MRLEVVFFAITYALVFIGYVVTSGFLNILYPTQAFIGFAIFFGFYAVASLVSPFIISKLDIRLSLFVSSFGYLIYAGLASSQIPTLMLIGSGIGGIGNAVIWLTQGAWMKSFPDAEQGKLVGLFFGVFNINILVGNLLALIVLLTHVSVQFMIWIILIPTGIGTIMAFFVPPFSKDSLKKMCSCCTKQNNQQNQNQPSTSFFGMLRDVFTIVAKHHGYLLVPLYILQSIDLNITWQVMTKLLVANANGNPEKDIYNAAMYLSYGGAAVIFGILSGKISDKKGHVWIFIPYIVLEVLVLVGILLMAKLSNTGPLGLWIIIGFVKGASDNFLNTLVTVAILSAFQKESNLMFAFYRCTYAVSYVIISLLVGYISYEWILLICAISLISFVISYLFFLKLNKVIDQLDIEFTQSAVIIDLLVV